MHSTAHHIGHKPREFLSDDAFQVKPHILDSRQFVNIFGSLVPQGESIIALDGETLRKALRGNHETTCVVIVFDNAPVMVGKGMLKHTTSADWYVRQNGLNDLVKTHLPVQAHALGRSLHGHSTTLLDHPHENDVLGVIKIVCQSQWVYHLRRPAHILCLKRNGSQSLVVMKIKLIM
jgi:hypothetical protein